MSRTKQREKVRRKRARQKRSRQSEPRVQPGSRSDPGPAPRAISSSQKDNVEVETRHVRMQREINDLKQTVRAYETQLGRFDPPSWPPRYRQLLTRLTRTLVQLHADGDPTKGRLLQPVSRHGATTSMRDEGASTRWARREADRVIREVTDILNGINKTPTVKRRCLRSPNQCPMSGKIQTPHRADHVLEFCGGCGQRFPDSQLDEQSA